MMQFPGCDMPPKKVASMLLRITLGLCVLFMGIIHLKTPVQFSGYVGDGLGFLTPLGMLWGYIYIALMIVGGALLTLGMMPTIAAWTAGLALASIPAGMLLKSLMTGAPLDQSMAAAINGFVWLIVFMFVMKNWCGCCGSAMTCGCPAGACTCGTKKMMPPMPASTPAMPSATKKTKMMA